ncbi:MMPL family transporter [Curtobacterium aetherium]|uniref:MMPL family transporter n=1 Tax=Curtobacterium aetherium TaxID=2841594 RepID=UPI0034606406
MSFLRLMGTVGAVSVAVSILVALTLTPAMLSVVGLRILRKSERRRSAAKSPSFVHVKPMRTTRAIATLVIGVVALGTVALPSLGMRVGLPDGSSESTGSSQYRAFTAIAQEFGGGENGPLLVVADLPRPEKATTLLNQEATLSDTIASQKHVSAVAPIGASRNGRVVAFQVIPTTGPSSTVTENLVHQLRDLTPVSTSEGRVRVGVAGNASANIDVSDKLSAALPLYLIVVVGCHC